MKEDYTYTKKSVHERMISYVYSVKEFAVAMGCGEERCGGLSSREEEKPR